MEGGIGADRREEATGEVDEVVDAGAWDQSVILDRLARTEGALSGLRLQAPQFERALVEQRQGIVNLDVRLTALQHQIVVHNLGIVALQQAIAARATPASAALTGSNASSLVEIAKEFFRFLSVWCPGQPIGAGPVGPVGPDGAQKQVN